MKVILISKKSKVNATGEYDKNTGALTVLRGSTLSERIACSKKFRGAKSIVKTREGIVQNNILQKDVAFKSPSTAANFVTGNSTNGLIAWKDITGRTIKEITTEEQ